MNEDLTKDQIVNILDNLPETGNTNFPGMTYEQGIEEALLLILGDIDIKDFEYKNQQ